MTRKFYLLYFFALLSSCSPVQKILQDGQLIQTNFSEKIPFNFDYGIPIIMVNISGKDYRFMFDTGTPTILSPALAETLQLKPLTSGNTSDSQGSSSQQEFVVIPDMKIGNLSFENTGAVVIDLEKEFEFKCLDLDGIIGANQMAKAIWEIDYENNMLTASDDIANFDIQPNTQTIDFIPKRGQLTPLVPIKIASKTTYITFDTGSSGDFNLGAEKFNEEFTGLKRTEAIGSSSTGLYGAGKNGVTSYVKIPSFEVGTIRLENQIFEFRESASGIAGNSFFKNYRVIINWRENKIYMAKVTDYRENKIAGFGVLFRYINNKPRIAKIFSSSDAKAQGLLIDDEVIEINGKDTSRFNGSEACHYAFNDILTGADQASITVLRAGKQFIFNLKRETFLD